MLEERFNSLGRFLKNTFGERVNRMNIYIPGNIAGQGGAEKEYILCPGKPCETNQPADAVPPVEEQISRAKERIRQKFKYGKFIIHFHTYSNNSISLDALKKAVENSMQDNEVIGINVTVRIDSLDNEIIKFLSYVSEHIYLWVETGFVTAHDSTLKKLGLPFTTQEAMETITKLLRKDLRVSPHVVLGLPGETAEMMRETMKEASRLMVNGVNIQHFLFPGNSPFADALAKGELKLLSREEYISTVCDFIEILPPNIVLRRLISETSSSNVLPEWTKDKKKMLTEISGELEKRNSYQGCKNHSYAGIAKVFGEDAEETGQTGEVAVVQLANFADEDE
ncbi:MAG: TIGR01212 family radical SAM protein [Nitrospinota bacterium]|nr:TIGR01212 family radical SAM protein [Nitrospinota bacterium]